MASAGNGSGEIHTERRISKLEAIQDELIRRVAGLELQQDKNLDADHHRDRHLERHQSRWDALHITLERIEKAYQRLEADQKNILYAAIGILMSSVAFLLRKQLGF